MKLSGRRIPKKWFDKIYSLAEEQETASPKSDLYVFLTLFNLGVQYAEEFMENAVVGDIPMLTKLRNQVKSLLMRDHDIKCMISNLNHEIEDIAKRVKEINRVKLCPEILYAEDWICKASLRLDALEKEVEGLKKQDA